ncbi:MAG: arylsulfatase [Kiritimatiellae bacterium]|nr:arylsulfatase [Kiritimatiellia bacterium]MDD5522913.1 arylsulfatase [Kiritimatiellia bacterium]
MNTSYNRRNFLKMVGLGVTATILSSCNKTLGWKGGIAGQKKPNFLVILVDDMGFSDTGCYGGDIRTPNLDRLAENGLRFTNFYNTGRCWPSRASILTGYYPQQIRRDALPGIGGGARGIRPKWAPLLPKLLQPLGYRSYHSGKWHVDGKPVEQGFDKSFDYTDSDYHFIPETKMAEIEKPLQSAGSEEGYYASTAIADNAIRQLREHAEKYSDKPFFEYVAFTEPHFPVQAPKRDIDRYRDAYLKGWDQVRQERWKRMKEKGIVNCELSKLDSDIVPGWNLKPEQLQERIGPGEAGFAIPWDTLTEEQKRLQATKMAVHAAMVDRIDQEIGRILDQLKTMKAYDNTVIMFASDNGASAEQMIRGAGHDKSAPLGSAKSFICLGPGFSSAANTPLRLHKSWVHEGGISTPLIVHWPAGVKAQGELRNDLGHLIDIPPTLLELAGGKWPEKWEDQSVPKIPGRSLVPAFVKDGTMNHDYLWWYHCDNRAIRVGNWKLVSKGKEGPWELYDMKTDRCESCNLADKYPDKVGELSEKWTQSTEEFRKLALADGGGIPQQRKKKKKSEND